MPEHYAAILPNPFMPAKAVKTSRRLPTPFEAQAWHDIASNSAPVKRRRAVKSRKTVKRSKAR